MAPRNPILPSDAPHTKGDYAERVVVVDNNGNLITSFGGTISGALPAGNNNIGDVDIVTVPVDPFGANADAAVAAGATGSIQAKLRRATQGLEDLKSLIVLAAGTNAIGNVGNTTKSTPINGGDNANVTTSTTTPIASNAARIELSVCNDSDSTIYIALGTAAVLNKGIRLNANGGSWSTDRYTGDVRAIHGATGNKVLTWVEI